MAKLPPFKPFFFDWRQRCLSELSGANFKVWSAFYWRSDKEDQLEISNTELARMCNLHVDTVKLAKAWLKKHGWLVVEREAYRDEKGQWITPVIRAVFPSQVGKPTLTPGGKNPLPPRVEKPAAGNSHPIVNTCCSGSDAPRLPVDGSIAEDALEPTVATAVAGAAAAAILVSSKEQELLDYWYERKRKTEDDLTALREIAASVSDTRLFLGFVFQSEPNPNGKWDGWDKKSPNLPALAKHVRNGFILQQFEEYLEEAAALGIPLTGDFGIPRSKWDDLCRTPACLRPWYQEVDGIKLCVECVEEIAGPPLPESSSSAVPLIQNIEGDEL
jgi:hypothetical protein